MQTLETLNPKSNPLVFHRHPTRSLDHPSHNGTSLT